MATVLDKIFANGELPEVKVEIGLTNETIIDMAVAGLIVAIMLTLLNKYLLSKL